MPVLLGSLFIDYTMLTEIFGGRQLFFLCNSAKGKSESYEKMRYYIRQIFNYYRSEEGQGILLKNSIYYQFLYLLTTEFIVKKGMQQYESLRGIHDERMNEILGYIMSNYRESVTLKELAERLYLSGPYLSKYIKQNFGMSFLKLLNNIRLEHAVSELLYTDKTIMKIAMDNGFPNLAGFNQTFKESYHTTPAEYRARMQQDGLIRKEEADSEEVLEQVRFLKETLDFQYIRFWNLLSEDMMIQMDTTRTKYNFHLIDQVFDYIVSIGIIPHVELAYKEKVIMSEIDESILGRKHKSRLFIMEKNKGFLEELAKHWAKRYGPAKVGKWYIELEQNAVIQETVELDKYFEAFETVAGIFKNAVPDIKVGGAGFSLNYMGEEFPEIIER